jgi:hypothetical protein
MSRTKPPLGIMPDRIWKERRATELVQAMHRYLALLNTTNAEDNEAASDMLHQWARELIALNLPRAMPF